MNDFKWTDKSAVKWFVIYSEGHEGPYSLEYLEHKVRDSVFNNQTKVWSEGLNAEMTLEAVFALSNPVTNKNVKSEIDESDFPPSLPPIPIEKEIIPASTLSTPYMEIREDEDDNEDEELEIRVNAARSRKVKEKKVVPVSRSHIERIAKTEESYEEEDIEEEDHEDFDEFVTSGFENREERRSKKWILPSIFSGIIIISFMALFYYLQDQKKNLEFSRPQGMSLKTADRIHESLEFKKWNSPLFFKEFISDDYSSLWLASSSFQKCRVTAHFKSQKEKILSLTDEDVEFEGVGKLSNHLTEFNKFEFLAGKKIVPGMYDMTISAQDCEWDGIIPKVMNLGKSPEADYSAKMTVILYSKGATEFKDLLDRVVRKKLEKSIQDQNQLELFWQGIQEKLQTLLAITLQVEQLFLDFTSKDDRQFHVNVLGMIDTYTKRFGPFLTNFVVSNQDTFKELSKSDLRGVSTRKNYEMQISASAKAIGYTSMKLIEDFQKLKNPRRVQLNSFSQRIKKEFSQIKSELNQKIIQVSDDRSLSPVEDQELQSPSQQ